MASEPVAGTLDLDGDSVVQQAVLPLPSSTMSNRGRDGFQLLMWFLTLPRVNKELFLDPMIAV